jgi:ATP-binding cassette subfamily B protein
MKSGNVNKSTYIRIFKLIKPSIPWVILSLIMASLNVFSSLYMPVLIGRAIDEMIGAEKVSFTAIKEILLSFTVMIIVNALSGYIMTSINNKVAIKTVKDLRISLFNKIHSVPVSTIDSMGQGDILTRLISDVERLSDGLLLGFSQVFTGVLTILATLVFMVRINLMIAILVIILTPVSLFAASFISKRTFTYFKKQADLQGKLTTYINENVKGVRVVKAFNSEDAVFDEFKDKNKSYSKANLKALFYSSTTNPVTRFVNNLVYAGVGILGGILGIQGRITIGTLSCFLSYANQYTKPFNEISGVFAEFQNAVASSARIFEFLDKENRADGDEESFKLESFEGNVDVKDLSFSYDKNKKLLVDITFSVKKGDHIAIVGPTGCGKTTFINLLMRFYDPDKGDIYIDNNATTRIPKSILRKNIGMVLQDTWLKEASVLDNIRYGNPDATLEEVMEAAKKAHAHSFIMRLENGYETQLAADGENISQGQKQLLCIARLMLNIPPILILDEATSSIDTRTEIKITEAFETLMKGRTSFIVAHRLSTIRNADLILVMKGGNIIEMGNHTELINRKGFYYELLTAR